MICEFVSDPDEIGDACVLGNFNQTASTLG